MATELAAVAGRGKWEVKRKEFPTERSAPGRILVGASFGWGIAPRVMN